ncbi:MAG TPA: hypothetical protein VLV86_06125, partial [Vicinamibacterales bacterium]|nr:hypothetical protein [Vicinamibacterales bacterium]
PTTSTTSTTSTSSSTGIQLTIRSSGTGAGTVNASPSGPYKSGDVVVLTAMPGSSSVFSAWTAPCPTTIPPPSTCTLTLTTSTTVTVQFDLD